MAAATASLSEANELGKAAFREKDYAEAIRHFSKAISSYPPDALVLANRSTALANLGRLEEALEDAEAAVKADPTYVKGYYRKTSALLALNRPGEAERAAAVGLAIAGSNKQLMELQEKARAMAAEQQAETEAQANAATMRSGSAGANAAAGADGAGAADGGGDDDETDEEGDEEGEEGEEDSDGDADGTPHGRASATPNGESMRISDGDVAADDSRKTARKRAEAHKEAGNVEYKRGRYDAAAQEYAEAMALDPENATYCCNRAAALLMLEQAEEALADSQRALELDPQLLKAHVRAAKSLCQLGRLSDARRQLEQAVGLPGSEATLQAEFATLAELEGLLRNGKSALQQEGETPAREAAHLFGILAARCPCSVSIACLQMEAVLRSRPKVGAPQVLSESARWMRRHKDQPDLLCVRGKALYGTGQLDQALKHFNEALRLDPDHSAARKMRVRLKEIESTKNRGNEAFQAGRYDEAITAYTEAMEIDQDNEDLHLTLYTNRATAKFKARDYAGCVDDCNAALAISPRHLKALLRRGAAKLELEQYNEAIADYEEAQRIDPNDSQGAQGLRKAKLELKKSLRKDLYKLLGVSKHASEAEIKKAYKKAALQWHPDRHHASNEAEKEHAEKMFKEIGEAFEILSDPQKKQKYDEGADIEEINGSGGPGGMGGMDPMDIFRMYSSMGGSMGSGMGGMPGGRRRSTGGIPPGFGF